MTIVSYRHGFIFIKNLKTAGTSIEVHLAAQCAEGDIVTPILPPSPEHRPRNHLGPNGEAVFYNHMPATEVQRRLPQAFVRSFKFCFERHPVDKCLSHYAMLRNSPLHQRPDNPTSWGAYLERGDFPVDVARYTDGQGRLLVDKVYKYEVLAAALADIAARTGIADQPLRSREKSGFRFNVPGFAEVMADPAQRRVIFDAFAATLRWVDYA